MERHREKRKDERRQVGRREVEELEEASSVRRGIRQGT
jgi:hypothetical protein